MGAEMGTRATVKATPRTNLVKSGQKGRKGGTKGGREGRRNRGREGKDRVLQLLHLKGRISGVQLLPERETQFSVPPAPPTHLLWPRSQRYSRADVLNCFTASCPTEPMGYLDAAESAQPTITEQMFWERFISPAGTGLGG